MSRINPVNFTSSTLTENNTPSHDTARFKYYLKVFGCQMNVADINDLEHTLKLRGGAPVQTENEADIVIVNTCVVRKKAEDKAISYIGMLRRVKERNPKAFLSIIGCLVPKSREQVEKRFPFIDLWVDFSAPEAVAEALDSAFPPMMASGAGYTSAGVPFAVSNLQTAYSQPIDDQSGPPLDAGDSTALSEVKRSGLVTIIRGCNNRCTYCIVPSVRGREISIPADVILADVKRKVEMGFKMITLLGQNVLTYGRDRAECPGFPALVSRILAETCVNWLHFLTSHPRDLFDNTVVELYKHDRLLNSLHLPFQAGSNRILDLMNRGYTRDEYIERIAAVRRSRADIFITTDVIVGFPSETRAEFEESLDLMSKVKFNDAYMFRFSPREGTPAADMGAPVPDEHKKAWLTELIALQHSISREVNREYIGNTYFALVEETHADRAVARLPLNKPVNLSACLTPAGEFVEVEITNVRNSTFEGRLT